MIAGNEHIVARGAARAMEKSSELLRRAADGSDSEAAYALGVLLLLGHGLETNFREALKLLDRATEAGVEDAAYFRDLAAEQVEREAAANFERGEAVVEALLEAKRRELFPRPRLVKSSS